MLPCPPLNCGTPALAYGRQAGYPFLDRDGAGGEESFRSVKEALRLTESENRPGATAMVYGDVPEAYWRVADQTRAIDVFRDGRVAGADK